MGRCPACGEPLADDAAFCGSCGTRLADAGPADHPSPSAPATPAPPPPMPTFSHSELMHPTPAAPPPSAPPGGPRRVSVLTVAIVGVVVLAAATFLIVQLGETGRGADEEGEQALTVEDVGEALDAVTTPQATEQQYIDALLADNPDLDAGYPPEVTTCVYRAMVVAVGGPEALHRQAISPEEFAALDALGGLELPPGAASSFLAASTACGFDLTEALLHGFALEFSEPEVACLRAGIDRALVEHEFITYMFGSSTALFAPSPALQDHLMALGRSCLAPG